MREYGKDAGCDVVRRIPDEYIELTDEEDIVKFDRLLTLLEDVDDVQEFYHNVDR